MRLPPTAQVTMRERTDAEKACRDPNPIIDGRKANVNLAYLGAKPRNNVQLSSKCLTIEQRQNKCYLRTFELPTAAADPNAASSFSSGSYWVSVTVHIENIIT